MGEYCARAAEMKKIKEKITELHNESIGVEGPYYFFGKNKKSKIQYLAHQVSFFTEPH